MILKHYIYREIAQKLISIFTLLLLIFVSKYYVEYLADAAAGKISGGLVLHMLSLKIVALLPQMLPVVLFLSIILAFSRLKRDNELVIFYSSGVGRSFQLRSTLRFVTVFTLVFAVLTLFVAPWAEYKISQLKEQAKKDSDITGLTAGQFKEFSKGDRVVYLEKLSADKKAMEKVFLQVRQDQRLGVLTSDRARFYWDEEFGNRYVVFEDGKRYLGSPGMLDYQITQYDSYAILIADSTIQAITRPLQATDTVVLLMSKDPKHQSELQWRISAILTCILLSLLAVLLNTFSWGDHQYVLIFLGMLIYFIYSNLLGISKTLLKRDVISPYLGLWWVHILLVLLLLAVYHWPRIKIWLRGNKQQQVLPAAP